MNNPVESATSVINKRQWSRRPKKPIKKSANPKPSENVPANSPPKTVIVLKRPVASAPQSFDTLQSPPTTSAPALTQTTPPSAKPKLTMKQFIRDPSEKKELDAETAKKDQEPKKKEEIKVNSTPYTPPNFNTGRQRKKRSAQRKEIVQNHEVNQIFNQGDVKKDENVRRVTPVDDRETINEEELPYLEAEYVYPLKKKNNRFTKAIYFCRLCDHHINTLVHAKAHILTVDHKMAKEEKALISLLAAIPKPTAAHCAALNEILKLAAFRHARPLAELKKCEEAVEILSTLVKNRIHPECSVRMYGSCSSGFALKYSNLNLELVFPDHDEKLNHAKALMKAFTLIQETKNIFSDVQKDFCYKWPYVKFEMKVGDVLIPNVVLSVRNLQAYEISQFFKTYTNSFSCLKTIGVIWRYWAKICDLDNFQNGGLPAYAFDLMLVHYLQQCDPPFLPVLHELVSEDEKNEKKYETDGEKIRRSVNWDESEWNYAEIFIGLLRYYTAGTDSQAFVVNVRFKRELTRDAKGWNKKRLAIEDPFMMFKNLAQLTNEMFTYFVRCLQNSYKYFGIPQTFFGPLFFYENKNLVLSWTNETDSLKAVNSDEKPANQVVKPTNQDIEPTNQEVKCVLEKTDDSKTRSFQLIFNSNVRNIPANQSSADSTSSNSAEYPSENVDLQAQGSEDCLNLPDDQLENDKRRPSEDDQHPEKRNSRRKRSVRNFCVKKLSEIDKNEGNDLLHLILLFFSISDESQVRRDVYDRRTMLQIADQCRHSLCWPDIDLSNSYRSLFDFPKSRFSSKSVVLAKTGSIQIDKMLSDENDLDLDSDFVRFNRFDSTNDAGINLDDDLIDQKRETFQLTPDRCLSVEQELIDNADLVNRSNVNSVEIHSNIDRKLPDDCDLSFENLNLDYSTPENPIYSAQNSADSNSNEGAEPSNELYSHRTLFGESESEPKFDFSNLQNCFLDEKEILREIDGCQPIDKNRRDTTSSDDIEFRESEYEERNSPKERTSIDATPQRCDSQDQREKIETIEINLELISAANSLKTTDFVYKFEFFSFKNELMKPKVQCDSCRMFNHMAPYCPNPEKELPPLRVLPRMTNTYIDMQTFFVQNVFNNNRISWKRQNFQESFRQDLEMRLKSMWPDANLYLFGSSCNGFGFTHSDLDICLTFGNQMTLPEGIDPVKVIRNIARYLHKQHDFCDILPVTRAKVPIVRFFHRESKLEGDISLYNILALRNTNLLYLYSLIDTRVQPLGYMAKVFAKQCDIGDASKGSLSSYAYVLMVIHYLQRRQPPVLPILQQIQLDPKRPVHYLVEGWETYFYEDIRNLGKFWKGLNKNKESIGELWLGFLIYYTEIFDPRNDVVQIRQSSPLTKFEKLWTDRQMAIEDPFDLNHNLASGLSKKMFLYIVKAFRRAREVFGDPKHEQLIYSRYGNNLSYENLGTYYFCNALVLNESPPKDRVCKYCERVGHFVENCPMKRSNKGKLMDELMNEDIEDEVEDVTMSMTRMEIVKTATNKTMVFENSTTQVQKMNPNHVQNIQTKPNRIVIPQEIDFTPLTSGYVGYPIPIPTQRSIPTTNMSYISTRHIVSPTSPPERQFVESGRLTLHHHAPHGASMLAHQQVPPLLANQHGQAAYQHVAPSIVNPHIHTTVPVPANQPVTVHLPEYQRLATSGASLSPSQHGGMMPTVQRSAYRMVQSEPQQIQTNPSERNMF